jgi:hypothetical protein
MVTAFYCEEKDDIEVDGTVPQYSKVSGNIPQVKVS